MRSGELMRLADFAPVFARLAIQLRQTDADEGTIRVYYAALADLDLELLAMAADRLARVSDWFPKTSEWRDMARKVEVERIADQRAILRKLPAPLCLACDDTGWDRTAGVARKCTCRTLRRLEVLGRRPMPTVPQLPAGDPTQAARALALAREAGKTP